jgi:hypothetical protein
LNVFCLWTIWLCVTPSGEVDVCLWMSRCGNVVLLTIRFFEVAKFIILTPLSLVVSCWLSLPFPPSLPLHWNLQQNFHMLSRDLIKYLL